MPETNVFKACFDQIFHNPMCAGIILFIWAIGYVFDRSDKTDSRWLALVCMACGAFLYWGLTSPKTVSPDFPRPWLVLVLNGAILGFIAYLTHTFGVKAIIDYLVNKARLMLGQNPSPPSNPPTP